MSRAKLTLKANFFNKSVRRGVLRNAVIKSGEELVNDVKDNILNSKPQGKTFRKGRITAALSKRNQNLGLKRFTAKNGKEKVITGYKIGRRSKRGQPPAIQTGVLRNSVNSKPLSDFAVRVAVGADYGTPLDDPNKLDRPFFISRAKKFQPRFQANMDEAVKDLT